MRKLASSPSSRHIGNASSRGGTSSRGNTKSLDDSRTLDGKSLAMDQVSFSACQTAWNILKIVRECCHQYFLSIPLSSQVLSTIVDADVIDDDRKASGFDLSEPRRPYKPLPFYGNDDCSDDDYSEEEDSFDWGTSVVVARRVDRSDTSFTNGSAEDEELLSVPVYHTVGVIPSQPPDLPVRRKPPRFGPARVVTDADRAAEALQRKKSSGALAMGVLKRDQDIRTREQRTEDKMRSIVSDGTELAPASHLPTSAVHSCGECAVSLKLNPRLGHRFPSTTSPTTTLTL